MQYQDLTFYRIDMGANGMFSVYPEVINIGWLDGKIPFWKGSVPPELLMKLKELTFSDQKNVEDMRAQMFDSANATIVHTMHMRGSPYRCPLCPDEKNEISITPDRLFRYSGQKSVVLGRSEMCISSVDGRLFYSFPTLLYHYVEAHQYLPPAEFIKALKSFNLDAPFNIDDKRRHLRSQQLTVEALYNLDLKRRRT